MKKLLIFVLAIMFCFGAVACGAQTDSDQDSTTEAQTTEAIPEETTQPPEGRVIEKSMYDIFAPQGWIISENATEKNRIIMFNTSKTEESNENLQRVTVKVEEGSSTQEQCDKSFNDYKTAKLSGESSTATVSGIEFDVLKYTSNGLSTEYYHGLANNRIMTILVESGSAVEDTDLLTYIVDSISIVSSERSIAATEAQSVSEMNDTESTTD